MYTLTSENHTKELNDAVAMAHMAGAVMMHYYHLDYSVEEKGDEAAPESAIFTEVDGMIDRMVQTFFGDLWPEDMVLSEETDPSGDWYLAERIWIIDPIDGTMGYKNKTGCFGISIALVENGQPVLGAIYAPAQNLTAWAVKGEGTFLNGSRVELHNHTGLNTLLCSSNSIHRPEYRRALSLIEHNTNLKRLPTESVVVKALFILQQKGEIYPILPLSEETKSVPKYWDIAAADILLTEAGGKVSTFSGDSHQYNTPEFRCTHGVLMGTQTGHRFALKRLQSL